MVVINIISKIPAYPHYGVLFIILQLLYTSRYALIPEIWCIESYWTEIMTNFIFKLLITMFLSVQIYKTLLTCIKYRCKHILCIYVYIYMYHLRNGESSR